MYFLQHSLNGDGYLDVIVGEHTKPDAYAGGGPLVFWGTAGGVAWIAASTAEADVNPLQSGKTGFVGTVVADHPGFMGTHQRVACGE